MAYDISKTLGSTGVELEANAFGQFGAAVEGKLNPLFGGIANSSGIFGSNRNVLDPMSDAELPNHGVWDPTPYASAFASGHGGLDPKTKFLFKVHFVLSSGVDKEAASILGKKVSDLTRYLTFTIKKIDLPKYNFEYEEVNYYNYRTKVLKKIDHEALRFVMHDTTGNQAQDFLNLYLKLLVPLSRRVWEKGTDLQDYGMEFTPDVLNGVDTSMRQALQNNARNILDSITIEQYYLDRTTPNSTGMAIDLRQAIRMNKFIFLNPKILKFDLEDQDHDSSDPGSINCEFDFDALHMDFSLPGDIDKDDTLGPNDLLAGSTNGKARGNASGLGGRLGPYLAPLVGILANNGAAKLSPSINNLINKTGLNNVAGGALRGTTNSVSAGLSTGIANSIAKGGVLGILGASNTVSTIASKNKVKDSAVGTAISDNNVTQTFPDNIA